MSTRVPAIAYTRGGADEVAPGFRTLLGGSFSPRGIINEMFGVEVYHDGTMLPSVNSGKRTALFMLRNAQPIYAGRQYFERHGVMDGEQLETVRFAHASMPFAGMYAHRDSGSAYYTFVATAYAGAMRMNAHLLDVSLYASKLCVDSEDGTRRLLRGRTKAWREAYFFARSVASNLYSRGFNSDFMDRLGTPFYASMALHAALHTISTRGVMPFDTGSLQFDALSQDDRNVFCLWREVVDKAICSRDTRSPLGLFLAFSGYDYSSPDMFISAPDVNRMYESALLGFGEKANVYGENGKRTTRRTSMALSTWVGKIEQLIRKYEHKESRTVLDYARWIVMAYKHGCLDKFLWVSEPKMELQLLHGDAVIGPYMNLSDSSCMRKNPHDCLTLYSRNPESVALGVFTRVHDGASEQVGRALLWRVKDGNGKEHVYMDRIYDRQGVAGIDTNVLRKWAIARMVADELVVTWPTDGKEFTVHVQLESNSFENYYYHMKDDRKANKNVFAIVNMRNDVPFPYMDNMRGIQVLDVGKDTITYELSPRTSGRGEVLQTANYLHMNYCMDPRRALGEDFAAYIGVSDLSEDGCDDDDDSGTVWSDYHGERIDEDDAVWSESLQSHVLSSADNIEYSAYHDDYIDCYSDDYVRITLGDHRHTLVHVDDAVYCEDTEDWVLESCATQYMDADECTAWTFDGSVVEDHEGVSRLESECTVCEDENGNDVYVLTCRVEDYNTHIAISKVEESEEA